MHRWDRHKMKPVDSPCTVLGGAAGAHGQLSCSFCDPLGWRAVQGAGREGGQCHAGVHPILL